MTKLTLRGCPPSIRDDAWWLDRDAKPAPGGYRNGDEPRSLSPQLGEAK